jgi:signal transduction histidine kinase
MNKLWKPFAELGTALRNSFTLDIFTEARLKIAILYCVTGFVILGVASYLVYTHILAIVQDVINIIQVSLQSGVPLDPQGVGALIAQAVNTEVAKMNLVVGLWAVFTLVVSSYVLAGVTLWPIRKAMEKQRRFIANVAHELRTPLSVMKMEAEVTLRDATALRQEELVDVVKSNLEEVDNLAKITQFLLDFSHLESRLSTLALSRVDVFETVAKAVKTMEKIAAEKQVVLTLLPAPTPPVIALGNATALEEMTLNLLKNAVNYTRPGGTVTVWLSPRRAYSGAILTIQDTGIGIPPEDMKNLFEPFYRGKNARDRGKDHDTGLGLAIVKEIANLHRATVSVKSALGHGTTVSVRFPLTFRNG